MLGPQTVEQRETKEDVEGHNKLATDDYFHSWLVCQFSR